PGRTRGHQRGELLAAYGENFVAIDRHSGRLPDRDKLHRDVGPWLNFTLARDPIARFTFAGSAMSR
ncbi:hypothetical protein RCF19_34080, partial [Rhodococcus qingshengii]